ncbi:MAG: hypothetical protein WCY77_04745 [Weeksellaceae bacterium]
MKLFYENISARDRVSRQSALESSLEQALEVFEYLPEDDGSSMGFIHEDNIVIQILKYNRFLWLIEIPVFAENGAFQATCNRNQCKRIIARLFSGDDPFSICDFKFESNL